MNVFTTTTQVVEATDDQFSRQRILFQAQMQNFEINTPKPDVHRDLERGWMLDYILTADELFWGRWEYWAKLKMSARLPPDPIPRIEFWDAPHTRVWKMLEKSLNAISNTGEWMSWSSYIYFDYFLDWCLWGMGCPIQKECPKEPRGCEGASDRLYQIFNCAAMILYPYDYFGAILSECAHGRHNGFFPTPHHLIKFMVKMTFGDGDNRLKSVHEPCMGTGRMLMEASNYSLCLSGMDKDLTVYKATLVNGYLYAPWLVCPFAQIDLWREQSANSENNLPKTQTDLSNAVQTNNDLELVIPTDTQKRSKPKQPRTPQSASADHQTKTLFDEKLLS